MLVSVSRSPSDADYAHRYCDAVAVERFRDLGVIVCGQRRWSPIVWQSGCRRQDHFNSAELIVLDFDDGKLSLRDAVEHFKEEGTRFLLGTTRSHGLAKGATAPQDRFRVILQMDAPVSHLGRYKQNMRRILSAYPADQACGDGARIYRPCTQIIAMEDGALVPMLPYQESPPRAAFPMQLVGRIPAWVSDVLSRDHPGARNSTVFRVAARLSSYGFGEAEIRRIISGSAISLPPAELEAAVGSGIRCARQAP
jgi:hypothetical protein